jgi:hypothetical protein
LQTGFVNCGFKYLQFFIFAQFYQSWHLVLYTWVFFTLCGQGEINAYKTRRSIFAGITAEMAQEASSLVSEYNFCTSYCDIFFNVVFSSIFNILSDVVLSVFIEGRCSLLRIFCYHLPHVFQTCSGIYPVYCISDVLPRDVSISVVNSAMNCRDEH